jgi:hypothetical protein
MVLEVVPVSVGVVTRAWDLQREDLVGAARQIAHGGAAGFSPGVSGAAAQFLDSWSRFAADLAEECEARADGLRATLADYVASDEASFVDLLRLGSFLGEVR